MNPYKYKFGITLLELLDKKNLTQRILSRAIGCTEASMSKWINGTRKPNVDALYKMSKYLGCTMEYLITGGDDNGR